MKRSVKYFLIALFFIFQAAALAYAGSPSAFDKTNATILYEDADAVIYGSPIDDAAMANIAMKQGAARAAQDPVIVFDVIVSYDTSEGSYYAGFVPIGTEMSHVIWGACLKAGKVTLLYYLNSTKKPIAKKTVTIEEPQYIWAELKVTPKAGGTYLFIGGGLYQGIKKLSMTNSDTYKYVVFEE